MSGLVYKVGDFEIDLMRVYEVEGDCLRMDDYRFYGVGFETADAIRKIIGAYPSLREQPQDTCDKGRAPLRGSACESSGSAFQQSEGSSTTQVQPECRSSVITSFPGDKAPEKDATTGTGGTTGTI